MSQKIKDKERHSAFAHRRTHGVSYSTPRSIQNISSRRSSRLFAATSMAAFISLYSLRDAHGFSFGFFGPSRDDMAYSYVLRDPTASELEAHKESHKNRMKVYGSGPPVKILQFTTTNNSDYYITGIEFRCSIYDANGNRLANEKNFPISGIAGLAPGNTDQWQWPFSADLWISYSSATDAKCTLVDVEGKK